MVRDHARRSELLSVGLLAILIAPTSMAMAAEDAALPIPFNEVLADSRLDPAWAVHVSAGNTVSVAQGQIEIKARTNTYAHISRRLSRDFVRASCELKAGAGVSWCTSLFLYWRPGDWCQAGILQEGGGRFYVTEMAGGRPTEYRLSNCHAETGCHVAIELGADCIRYLSSADGRKWKVERGSRRPAGFNVEPALLIVGKGYGTGTAPNARPDLDNDYQDPGPPAASQVRDIRVEPTAYSHLRATPAERANWDRQLHDLVGEEELAAVADPTFDSVSKHFPALKYPREIVGVKDHPHDIGVTWDGMLQLNDANGNPKLPVAWVEIGDPPRRFGSGPTPCRKRLLEGYMPVVIADWTAGALACEQTVFGYTKGLSPDEPLFAYVRLKLKAAGGDGWNSKVRLCIKSNEQLRTAGEYAPSSTADATAIICVKIPFDVATTSPVQIEPAEFDAKLAEVRQYWRDLLKTGERFSVPEQRVQDAYRAWLAYSFLNVDKRDGGIYHICDGAGFYEEIYGYSAALYCHVLDLLGYHDFARTYIDSLLTFQQPDGLFCVNFGHTDTGTLLHVMAEHYRITNDAEWLRRVAPKMVAMCNWIISHRGESMKQIHGKRAMVHGLIRYRPYCDHELPAFDYYSNGYLCTGMAETARVFGEIGMNAESLRLTKEADAFRKDILTSMDMAIIDHDGVRMLPIMPDTQTLLKESNYTANGYYGLLASCLLETNVLEPKDPRAQLIVDSLEQRGGLTAGMCQFFGSIDHAYTYGYWLNCLQRDEPKKAILGLYGSMAYGMSRDTYAGVEVTAIRTGENAQTLPHQYSCSKQLRLLRNMLLREQGDELLIGQAIPRPWLEPGKVVEVRQAPTDFGPVSYRIEADATGRKLTVRLDAPTRKPPTAIRIWLRHPQRRTIQSVRAEPEMNVSVDGEEIRLKPAKSKVSVQVNYR